MPPVAHPTAEDRQWRRRRKGSRTGGPLHGLRMRDLQTVFWHRYKGRELSPDDSGKEDALVAVHHLLNYAIDPQGRARAWLAEWCPWMHDLEARRLIRTAIDQPRRYRADTLAIRLNLTAAERSRLDVTTIGAVDMLKEKRAARRRQRDRARKERERRDRGAKTAAEIKTNSKSRQAPWKAAGMSRATWYRRHRETVAATA